MKSLLKLIVFYWKANLLLISPSILILDEDEYVSLDSVQAELLKNVQNYTFFEADKLKKNKSVHQIGWNVVIDLQFISNMVFSVCFCQ